MRDRLAFVWDEAVRWLKVAGYVAWRLPVVPCPACHGNGGEVQGYYEPEWVECDHCDPFVAYLNFDHGLDWLTGRVHPVRWPWIKFRVATGHYRISGYLLCKLGRHLELEDMPGICSRCYCQFREER